jgi:hypothetical protein
MEYLQVKNWARFQHYKHRKPPWIRLYRDLLDSLDFHSLPLASRALAPLIWLLASDTVEGRIEYIPEQIAFRLRTTVKDLEEALKPLIDKGFLSLASNTLASRVQHATPEGETERESETEKPLAQTPRKRSSTPLEQEHNVLQKLARLAREHDIDRAIRAGTGPLG